MTMKVCKLNNIQVLHWSLYYHMLQIKLEIKLIVTNHTINILHIFIKNTGDQLMFLVKILFKQTIKSN